jgi:hypothetical protein
MNVQLLPCKYPHPLFNILFALHSGEENCDNCTRMLSKALLLAFGSDVSHLNESMICLLLLHSLLAYCCAIFINSSGQCYGNFSGGEVGICGVLNHNMAAYSTITRLPFCRIVVLVVFFIANHCSAVLHNILSLVNINLYIKPVIS